MRFSRSALWVMPALLLSLVIAIPLPAQSSASGAKGKSAQDDWNAPTQDAPNPQGSKAGKSDTKNVADGAAKGQANEGMAPNPNGGSGGGKGSSPSVIDHNSADGAAKGQATEGIYFKPHDSASPSVAMDGQGSGTNDRKAVEHPMGEVKSKSAHDDWSSQTKTAAPPQGSGSGDGKGNSAAIKDSKNIADGAAKGQAVDGMDQNPNGGSGGGNGKNASTDVHKNIADGAAKGQAVDGMDQNPNGGGNGKGGDDKLKSKSAVDNWQAQTRAEQKTSSGPAGGKSGTDDWNAPTSTAPKPAANTTKSKSATDDWQSHN